MNDREIFGWFMEKLQFGYIKIPQTAINKGWCHQRPINTIKTKEKKHFEQKKTFAVETRFIDEHEHDSFSFSSLESCRFDLNY